MSTRTATGAVPMPVDGKRRLSPSDALRRARAMACVRDPNSTRCQGRVFVNIFFDGTGNNFDWNGPFVTGKTSSTQTQRQRNGHSNVARLWDARIEEPENGLFNFYIPGVGTPFAEIGDSGAGVDGMAGAGAARKGADRINWGIVQVYNAIHRYLTGANLIEPDQARTIVNNMSSQILQLGFANAMRRVILKVWEDKLAAVVRTHQRKLLDVNISVFGFSRGAAQARAFVHWLYEIAKSNNEGCTHVLAGASLKFKFLGIFDTVASVGLASISRISEGKMAWAEGGMMSIHPAVERCVHFAALHEQRMCFPLDLAVGSGVHEVLYPGMHSDVGGGYAPSSQGKGMATWGASPNLSQVPLVDMHFEAVKAGVPLMTVEEIAFSPWSNQFACDERLVTTYNAWLTSHGLSGGSHREQIRAHTRQYLRWRGMRSQPGEQNLVQQRFYQESDKEDQYDLRIGQGWFANRVNHMRLSLTSILFGNRELLDALPGPPVPRSVADLFDNYVHDSLAGFYIGVFTELSIPGLRTDGYLRYRGVFDVNSEVGSAECAVPEPIGAE